MLCTTTGKPITLESVDYDVKVKPVALDVGIRTVAGGKIVDSIGSQLGRPPNHFDSPPKRMAGSYTEAIKGTEVRRLCTDRPDQGFQEILTSMELGKPGGWVTGMSVDYSTEGKEYRLHLDWDYLGCGSAIKDPDLC